MEAKIQEIKTKNKTFTKKKKKAYNEGFTGITNIIANILKEGTKILPIVFKESL